MELLIIELPYYQTDKDMKQYNKPNSIKAISNKIDKQISMHNNYW